MEKNVIIIDTHTSWISWIGDRALKLFKFLTDTDSLSTALQGLLGSLSIITKSSELGY